MGINMVRCAKCGGFYNSASTDSCPYCAGLGVYSSGGGTETAQPAKAAHAREESAEGSVNRASNTVLITPQNQAANVTTPVAPQAPAPAPAAPATAPAVEAAPEAPVSNATRMGKFDPVVGWLVCVDGVLKGNSYILRSENNFIGRSAKMDIRLEGDDSISDDNHAFITYDTRDKVFYLTPGEVRNIVRLNDKPVLQPAVLSDHDRIELGATKLLFIPLCNSEFDWESENK